MCVLSGNNPILHFEFKGLAREILYRGQRAKEQSMADMPFKYLLFLFNINPVLKVCDSESVTMAYPSPTFPQHGLR